jgi:hypothetical protein
MNDFRHSAYFWAALLGPTAIMAVALLSIGPKAAEPPLTCRDGYVLISSYPHHKPDVCVPGYWPLKGVP